MVTNKGKALELYRVLAAMESDFFSDSPKFDLSKDHALSIIKLAKFLVPLDIEYNEIIDTHKRIFFRTSGVTPESIASNIEVANKLLYDNMHLYFSTDESLLSDIASFESRELEVPDELLELDFDGAMVPHKYLHTIKPFQR